MTRDEFMTYAEREIDAVQYTARAFLPAGIANHQWKSLVHTKEVVPWTE